MNITLDIESASLDEFFSSCERRLQEAAMAGQRAMTEAFHGVVLANFGSTGFDRPWDWQALSPKYAKRVGRGFATLYVTGALKSTVQADPEAGTVSMGNAAGVPYALAHHHGHPGNFGWTQPGSGDLPARRVFPLDEADQVTDKTRKLVEEAGIAAVKEALK